MRTQTNTCAELNTLIGRPTRHLLPWLPLALLLMTAAVAALSRARSCERDARNYPRDLVYERDWDNTRARGGLLRLLLTGCSTQTRTRVELARVK